MYLNLSEEQKVLVDEISALSGIQKNVVREVWEFTLIRWAEQVAKSTAQGTRARLEVPFLGSVSVKYEADSVQDDGTVTTDVSAFLALAPLFQKMVGDIHDEGNHLVVDLLEKKIENATLTTSVSSH